MTSSSNRLAIISAMVVAGVWLSGVASATLAATATISSTPNGANFHYTIRLTNTGTSDIGTFWFSWTPPGDPAEYSFLPSSPLSTSQPAGWNGIILHQVPGYSIEYYNASGSAVSTGQTGTFEFTSSDSPAQLQGTVGAFPITDSFIYSGLPLVGTPAQVNPVFVPDTDGDGIPDSSDNCPFTPNGPNLGTCLGNTPQGQALCHANSDCTSGKCSLNQEDTGGIGTGSLPDGIGDACQCGDVDNNGIVNNNDATFIKRAVAGLAPYSGGVTTLPGYHKCQVTTGTPPGDTCNNTQASLISRAVVGLAPGIKQGCHAATIFP